MGIWEWIGWSTPPPPPPPSRPAPRPQLRSKKGTYAIGRQLGSGGFGQVYKATFYGNDGKSMEVALKKIRIDSNNYEYCKREVELMGQISASNTSVSNVKMYDGFASNLEPNVLCISMEYCDRGDLAGRIQEQRNKNELFDKKLIYQYMFDIADGIDELHIKHNIFHRDIKPGNILISYDFPRHTQETQKREILKISDYGLSKVVDTLIENSSMNASAMTMFYASPEQLAGTFSDKSADIWAIGLIFAELCLCPEQLSGHIQTIRQKVRTGKALTLPASFPQKDDDWLNQMLKQNPKDRITSGKVYTAAHSREW